jgi:hypothetical protein
VTFMLALRILSVSGMRVRWGMTSLSSGTALLLGMMAACSASPAPARSEGDAGCRGDLCASQSGVGAVDERDASVDGGNGAACRGALPACVAAANAPCEAGICALESLPSGEACSLAVPTCSMLIDPCPGADLFLPERVDSYGCVCESGLWSCAICSAGEGLCGAESDAAL